MVPFLSRRVAVACRHTDTQVNTYLEIRRCGALAHSKAPLRRVAPHMCRRVAHPFNHVNGDHRSSRKGYAREEDAAYGKKEEGGQVTQRVRCTRRARRAVKRKKMKTILLTHSFST
ncbi:hypothetical protein LtaPh_2824900 [Leishmania tarentolae]|uniref:Uncharacterized protein n=1 Tax=Leishmania tarentolae TaxID=5689 RepID=A0A640KRK6_LEITA|nr:hypothetical protein LtaPh_2824900 [Leishmania tarentolae]